MQKHFSRSVLCILFYLCLSIDSYGQDVPPPPPPPPPPLPHQATNPNIDSSGAYTFVEEMPMFPGGDQGLMKFLVENTQYPDSARVNKIQGTVYVSFVVEKDGKVGEIIIKRGVNKFLDDEALRVVSKMPAWTPGRNNGKPVRTRYLIPIKFRLT